jgi:hypothetical protein
MILFAISLLACLLTPISTPNRVATLSQQTPGSHSAREVVLETKPQFRQRRWVDIEHGPRPHGGSLRDQRLETWLEFNYGGKTYSALWSSKGWRRTKSPAPVELDEQLNYRFLIRLQDERQCVVLKVWRGREPLWSREGRKPSTGR